MLADPGGDYALGWCLIQQLSERQALFDQLSTFLIANGKKERCNCGFYSIAQMARLSPTR